MGFLLSYVFSSWVSFSESLQQFSFGFFLFRCFCNSDGDLLIGMYSYKQFDKILFCKQYVIKQDSNFFILYFDSRTTRRFVDNNRIW